MATKKSNSKSTSTKTTKSSTGAVWGLNKISMYTIVAVAVLYAISMVLSLINVSFRVVGALQGLATAVMIGIVSVLAWRYVAYKPMVWKVLYVLCLILVVCGVIIPLVV
ncbi:MAG: hypothetical protein IJE91_04500 [Clostridia bacterium]|nr:hypothetical protein [Clostridia bacterium]